MRKLFVIGMAWMLSTGLAYPDALTNEDIDLHISKMHILNPAFVALRKKLESVEELYDRMRGSSINNGFSTIVEIGSSEKLAEFAILETLVTDNGYQSVIEWSQLNDRIETVFFTASNMAGVSRFINGKKTGINDGTNLFSWLEDESNPQDVRDTISDRLIELCNLYCADQSDLESVGNRYGDLLSAYDELRKSR